MSSDGSFTAKSSVAEVIELAEGLMRIGLRIDGVARKVTLGEAVVETRIDLLAPPPSCPAMEASP